jgi:prophage DNA circulation protein
METTVEAVGNAIVKNAPLNLMKNVDAFMKQFDAFVAGITSFAREPLAFVQNVQNLVGSIASSVDSALAVVDAYAAMWDDMVDMFGDIAYPMTETGLTAAANDRAVSGAVLASIASYAVSAAVGATENGTGAAGEYNTRNDADRVVQALGSRVETTMAAVSELADDAGLFDSMNDLKIALVQFVPPEGARLKDIQKIRLNESVPAVVLSWMIYGDADHADEIAVGNGVRNPLFLPSGVDIEVLV